MLRIGFDVGGTFTDFVAHNIQTGELSYFKVPSTPADPSDAISLGLSEFLSRMRANPSEVSFIGHGTTVATNILLEKSGARTGMITSRGCRDVLELGRQTRPSLYDYSVRKPEPLIARGLRMEIDERLDAEGNVVTELNERNFGAVVDQLVAFGVDAIGICFIHSYLDDTHESRVARFVREKHPQLFVSTSSEVVPEFREFERFSATAVNCYVGPKMHDYVAHLVSRLEQLGLQRHFYTIHSNGGLMPVESLLAFPVRTCLSGPAAGVVGAAVMATNAGYSDVITFDVGGTSTDVSLIRDGTPAMSSDRSVAGYPMRVPMVDVKVIGAGGGSICWVDSAGGLKVGPRSAGATPGPVAYGLGGSEATLTDASIALHRLDPDFLLDGRVAVDEQAARAAIREQIAAPLDLSIEQAAAGMLTVATANMSRAIRSVSTEKGYDLGDFSLFAYGGAGPLYATAVARECGIARIIIPVEPGTICAQGMLLSDISFDMVSSGVFDVDDGSWSQLIDRFAIIEKEGSNWLENERIAPENRRFEWVVDARYEGQNHEIRVVLDRQPAEVNPADFIKVFSRLHRHEYGYEIEGREVEVVNCRVKAIGQIERPLNRSVSLLTVPPTPVGSRKVYFSDGWSEAPVFQRSAIGAGAVIDGPAIINEMSSTTIIDPDQRATCDEIGNLVLEFRS